MRMPKISKSITRIYFSLFFIVLFSEFVSAQTPGTARIIIEDGWIEKMNDQIAVDLSFNNDYETFKVKTPANEIVLYPNIETNSRLGLNYRFISFGFQLAPDFLPGNGEENIKGNTSSFDLGTSLIFRHWSSGISYRRVKGYYLENTADYQPWNKGEPYIQFPELVFKNFSLTAGYSTNPKFSFRSLTTQTERQLISAGTFTASLNVQFYTIDNQASQINSQNTENWEGSVGPGYNYTFVAAEKWYASLGFNPSIGFIHTKLRTRYPDGDIVTYQSNFLFRWVGSLGIGYNDPIYYFGMYANVSGASYKQANTSVMNFSTRFIYHIFGGMRFKAPEWLSRLTKKIEDSF